MREKVTQTLKQIQELLIPKIKCFDHRSRRCLILKIPALGVQSHLGYALGIICSLLIQP